LLDNLLLASHNTKLRLNVQVEHVVIVILPQR